MASRWQRWHVEAEVAAEAEVAVEAEVAGEAEVAAEAAEALEALLKETMAIVDYFEMPSDVLGFKPMEWVEDKEWSEEWAQYLREECCDEHLRALFKHTAAEMLRRKIAHLLRHKNSVSDLRERARARERERVMRDFYNLNM